MKNNILPAAIMSSFMLLAGSAAAQMPVEAVYLRGTTDSTGRFTINHQYQAEPSHCEGTRIVGATVAILNSTNGYWYIVDDSNNVAQAIAFGNGVITGYFARSEYNSQPVRVVLFLSHDLC
jgi:hypothetical protein